VLRHDHVQSEILPVDGCHPRRAAGVLADACDALPRRPS
jgi:hypothetical protein